MINKMKKLTLVASKSDIDSIANELLWLSSVEIAGIDEKNAENLSVLDSSCDITSCEQQRSALADAIDALSVYGSAKKKKKKDDASFSRQSFEGLSEKLDSALEIAAKVKELTQGTASTRSDINRIDSEIANLSPWKKLDIPLSLDSTRSTSIIKGTLPGSAKLDDIVGILEKSFDAIVGRVGDESSFICIYVICTKDRTDEVFSELLKYGFSKASFDGFNCLCTEEISKLSQQKKELESRIEENSSALRNLADERAKLENAYDYLNYRIDKLNIRNSVMCTEYTGILQGWLPEYAIPRLEKKLAAYECYFELDDPKEGEDVPVMLSNTPFASPFESIISMYAYPKYGTFDPTFIMSIFYAVIFGLIMQDVGYGLLLVIGCPLLMKMMKPKGSTKKMLKAFMICGFFTMFFGMMFGGYFSDLPLQIAQNWFGVEAESLPELALLFNPIENNMGFLILALSVGALHLVTGMLIKAYMMIREGDVFGAIFDIGSWLVLFAGLGLLLAVPSVGKWVAIAGAAMLILTQGRSSKSIVGKFFKGLYSLYDIINYMSDLLSYSRIFALGLSGAIIGQVMNILGTLAGGSIVGIIAFVLIFIVGQALNVALSLISAFVHTARLQYIEFFGKFYVDGGNPFKPASVNTKYSEITEEAK